MNKTISEFQRILKDLRLGLIFDFKLEIPRERFRQIRQKTEKKKSRLHLSLDELLVDLRNAFRAQRTKRNKELVSQPQKMILESNNYHHSC